MLLSLVSTAQVQKAEIFGGYQFTRLHGGPNLNGWNAALTGNFKSFGITADFSGTYGAGLSFYTYTFGRSFMP